VCEKGFGDLAAYGHHGVERCHGLLEDHGDRAAAMTAHGLFREGEEVFGARCGGEGDASGDVRLRWKEAHHGERGGGLAGAGLADEAEGLARGDGKGDAPHRLLRAEGDAQVADAEQRCSFGCCVQRHMPRISDCGRGEDLNVAQEAPGLLAR
jgi:hypothetical protein